jgi:hypothetical protein
MQTKKDYRPDASKETKLRPNGNIEKLQAWCKQRKNPGLMEARKNFWPDGTIEKLKAGCK